MMIVRILPNDNFPDLLTSVVGAYLQDGESAFTSQQVTDRLLSNGSRNIKEDRYRDIELELSR